MLMGDIDRMSRRRKLLSHSLKSEWISIGNEKLDKMFKLIDPTKTGNLKEHHEVFAKIIEAIR